MSLAGVNEAAGGSVERATTRLQPGYSTKLYYQATTTGHNQATCMHMHMHKHMHMHVQPGYITQASLPK